MISVVIAPIPELKLIREHSMHLVLAHLMEDDRYRNFYLEQSKAGSYIMLDNSTYENAHPVSPGELLTTGVIADEIAVPDKLGDCDETLRLAGVAFDFWSREPWRRHIAVQQPRFILTPQGKTLEEWRSCLFGLILRWSRFVRGNQELRQQEEVTIGLSTKTVSGYGAGAVDFVLEKFLHEHQQQGHAVHLWGVLGGFKMWDLNRIAKDFPWVRSVDTSKPIVYALNDISLNPRDAVEPKYPGRPKDYFERKLETGLQRLRAVNNIVIYRELAAGEFRRVEVLDAG